MHRIAWFHPPKTGTSFGATVLHYANSSLPATEGARLLWGSFWKKYPPDVWFKNQSWIRPCDHATVTEDVYRQFEGYFVGMFRQPETRLRSAYYTKGLGKGSFSKYAARAEGTVTMQLAGQAHGETFLYWPGKKHCGGRGAKEHEQKPRPNIEKALGRLQKGFMFVGLIEEYDLSVCLFHAMFGGDCLQVEFENRRPGKYKHDTQQQTIANTNLSKYSDVFDDVLYRAASRRFWLNVKKYNATRSSCLKLCPYAGKYFGSDLDMFQANESDYEHNWPDRYKLD